MKIVLVRHGQPDFDTRKWVGVRDVRISLQQYAELRVTTGPESDFLSLGSGGPRHFMTSGLARSKDSLKLCQNVQAEVSELLNEAELPYPDKLMFPLPWPCFLGICRLGWLLGYQTNAPGLSRDLERARQAASLLITRANEHENVYVFGHGIMNRLIVRELKKRDWHIQLKAEGGYWSRTVMIYLPD